MRFVEDAALAAAAYEGVTHAGIAIVAADTGRVLLALRAQDETDAPEVQRTWEFPGGSLEEGEDPLAGAFREFAEEIGLTAEGSAEVVDGWRAGEGGALDPEGHYQGFVLLVPEETPLDSWEPTSEVEAVRWMAQDEVQETADNDALRPELLPLDSEVWGRVWGAVSGNEEQDVDDETDETVEPEIDFGQVFAEPIPIHGVLAPEEIPTGDKRGFAAGSVTARPYRLPFRWAEIDYQEGHKGAFAIGSVDRLMRKDGVIHYQGLLMPCDKTEQFVDLLEFFGGRYGVSVDGMGASLDKSRSETEGMLWFEAVQAAGLTACDIPAFQDAYVALGPHPDMPQEDEEVEALAASGDLVTFRRGKGWVTNPKETKRLHDYWTKKGQPGYAKIAWGTPGDFRRAKALIGEKIAKNSPEKMRFLNQIIAQWHFDALGYWPGELGKPGNAPDTPENRRRAARHAKGVKASEDEGVSWETVLTSSAGERVLPPADYFTEHPETGALTVEEPDADGIRRVHGYAAEWGVCHIGYQGRCVEPPEDPTGEFTEFHLGRTKTTDGYLSTGLLTYNIPHRDAQTILSESAEQAHFDNLRNAWAAVRLGQNDRGIWFSGVVLPGVPEDDLVKIEAAGQVSGEWKYGALRGLLTVNIPGFPVMRSSAAYDEDGNVVALAASAFGHVDNGTEGSPCSQEDDPVADLTLAVLDRMEGRARMREVQAAETLRQFRAAQQQWDGGEG